MIELYENEAADKEKDLWHAAWIMTLRAGILKTVDEYNTYALGLYHAMVWAKKHTPVRSEEPLYVNLVLHDKRSAALQTMQKIEEIKRMAIAKKRINGRCTTRRGR